MRIQCDSDDFIEMCNIRKISYSAHGFVGSQFFFKGKGHDKHAQNLILYGGLDYTSN